MLGVMKAGGAFVPLDPTHPTSRLQRLIESVKASVVLCSQNRADTLRPIVKTLIPLCADTLERFAEGVDIASGVTSQNAAYVLFTSGSTGEPKVCFQHASPGDLIADFPSAGHPAGAPRVSVERDGPWPRPAHLP